VELPEIPPGLVGGHCIGVDPYYLTAKAEELGHHPEVILSGRRINDGMGAYVGEHVIRLLPQASTMPLQEGARRHPRLHLQGKRTRHPQFEVIDIYSKLQSYGIEPLVHDPLADPGRCSTNMAFTSIGWTSSNR
jgi:UDP-N-acetyl-D-galactosamine dehydrogenase